MSKLDLTLDPNWGCSDKETQDRTESDRFEPTQDDHAALARILALHSTGSWSRKKIAWSCKCAAQVSHPAKHLSGADYWAMRRYQLAALAWFKREAYLEITIIEDAFSK